MGLKRFRTFILFLSLPLSLSLLFLLTLTLPSRSAEIEPLIKTAGCLARPPGLENRNPIGSRKSQITRSSLSRRQGDVFPGPL